MNIISEVDYSRQVLEPKSIFSKAFQVSGNLLATSVHLLFITFMALASASRGRSVEGGWGVTGGLRRTPTPSVWTQRPGQKKPECWASGQRGMYLPRSVFLQQTSWSTAEGFTLEKGATGSREAREHDRSCWEGLSVMSQEREIWHLAVDS